MLLLLCFLALLSAVAWSQRRLLAYLFAFLRMQASLRWFLFRNRSTADLFAERVRASPARTALVFEGRSWSYAALDRASNRVASWARSKEVDLQPREVVALMMENRAEFVILWLGLAKVGVTSALINTNLRGSSLAHCVRSCDARMCIIGAECAEAFASARQELAHSMPVWLHVEDAPVAPSAATVAPVSRSHAVSLLPGALDLSAALASYPDLTADFAPLRARAGIGSSDLLFLIFTSGTTGLPKAARIKHLRFQMAAASFCSFFDLRADDRIYCCLPLYHSAGGMIGVCVSWRMGSTLVLRRKFSARNFFADCREHRCTVVQYIGQLCSYLLATPPSPADRDHPVRLAIGNGLSADVFRAFKSRFGIEKIAEFYASTEGNANLVNGWNLPGVIGWIPPVAKLVYPVRILRFDPITEQPVRDAQNANRCIECAPGEVGELVARIDSDPLRAFDGYTDARATGAKVLTNVLRTGDRYFRSGDLVRQDAAGLISFVDRVGDTFRWKGENVATTEVAAVLQAFRSPQQQIPSLAQSHAAAAALAPVILKEVNVYGVAVPGNEGRAGMASVVLGREGDDSPSACATALAPLFDFSALYRHCAAQLPAYAWPLFLRLQAQMDTTGTFKQRKGDLQAEGFDPRVVQQATQKHGQAEALYFRDDAARTFVPLDQALHARIVSGQVRV